MIDAEYVAPPPPPVPEPIPVIPQFNVEVTPAPVIVPEPVEEIVEIVPLIEPEPVPEPEPVAPQPVTPIEPDVFIVKLETGDKITIEPKTDEDEDVFAVFTSFRSTQFFVNDFEESSELLTLVKDKEPEELSITQVVGTLVVRAGLGCRDGELGAAHRRDHHRLLLHPRLLHLRPDAQEQVQPQPPGTSHHRGAPNGQEGRRRHP